MEKTAKEVEVVFLFAKDEVRRLKKGTFGEKQIRARVDETLEEDLFESAPYYMVLYGKKSWRVEIKSKMHKTLFERAKSGDEQVRAILAGDCERALSGLEIPPH